MELPTGKRLSSWLRIFIIVNVGVLFIYVMATESHFWKKSPKGIFPVPTIIPIPNVKGTLASVPNFKDLPTTSPNIAKAFTKSLLDVKQPVTRGLHDMEKPLRCPETPPGLVGPFKVKSYPKNLQEQIKNLSTSFHVSPGGYYHPPCTAHNRTAIIIPYRDRAKDLGTFLINMVPFLVRQQAEFNIFIIEPVAGLKFNRALLMNVGFVEALKVHNFTCFIFHDVDLVPENDKNLYRCHRHLHHFTTSLKSFHYKLPYPTNAGGVTGLSRTTFEDINGMSNLYFGWGGEDDDLYIRITWKRYKLLRYPGQIGRYYSFHHKHDKGNEQNPKRFKLLNNQRKNHTLSIFDGLNTLKYDVMKKEELPLYTRILINLDMGYYNEIIRKRMKSGTSKSKTSTTLKTPTTNTTNTTTTKLPSQMNKLEFKEEKEPAVEAHKLFVIKGSNSTK